MVYRVMRMDFHNSFVGEVRLKVLNEYEVKIGLNLTFAVFPPKSSSFTGL